MIGLAAIGYVLIVIYFSRCSYYEQDINRIGLDLFGPAASTANGYENSLMRWLLYFNPAAQLGEFIVGLAAAHVYLVTRQRSAMLGPAAASAMTLTAIALTVGLHLWLYGVIAPGNSFIGRTASQLSAPLVAVTVYLIARYETPSSHILSLPLPMRLGVASYSIYMLHEIVPSAFSGSACRTRTPRSAGSLGWRSRSTRADQQRVICADRASGAHMVRALLAPRRAPVFTAAQDS